MVYSYPVFWGCDLVLCRIFSGGLGLGNLLFPWARSIVAARKNGMKPIFPTWRQLRPQLYLQPGRDKRTNFGFFQPPPDAVSGPKKYWLLGRARRWPETRWREAAPDTLKGDWIVEFRDDRRRFDWLKEEHELVRRELLATTRQEHLVPQTVRFHDSISIHIRLGDFYAPHDTGMAFRAPNTRIPMDWYQHVIQDLRSNISSQLQVLVFSDGTCQELAPVLRMQGVDRVSFGSALADLHALSRANILVASGSSYSWWASYLGRCPVIWPKGRHLEALYRQNPSLETTCGHRESIPASFYEVLEKRSHCYNGDSSNQSSAA